MEVLFDRAALLEAFTDAARATPTRTGKPILHDLLLRAAPPIEGKHPTLTGTNHELAIRRDVFGAKVEDPGECILPTKRLAPILKSCPDKQLLVETTAKGLKVKSLNAKWEFTSPDPKEFPDVIPEFPNDGHFVLGSNDLLRALVRTKFATSESKGYALGGVLFELSKEDPLAFDLVGASGTTLATVRIAAEQELSPEVPASQTIVPDALVRLLASSIKAEDPPVHLRFTRNDAIFRTDRAILWGRLLEGRYPRWGEFVPKIITFDVSLKSQDLASAIEQARVCTTEESSALTLHFRPGKIGFRSQAADVGNSDVELVVEGMTPPMPFEVSYVPDLLLEFLKVIPGETKLTVEFSTPAMETNAPILLRTEDRSRYLVMPLNIPKV